MNRLVCWMRTLAGLVAAFVILSDIFHVHAEASVLSVTWLERMEPANVGARKDSRVFLDGFRTDVVFTARTAYWTGSEKGVGNVLSHLASSDPVGLQIVRVHP